jgi:hypothetical protein
MPELRELDTVTLTRDVPPARAGMVGTVMMPPSATHVLLEVFEGHGVTLDVMTVPLDAVELRPRDQGSATA